MDQARVVDGDCARSESEVARVATTRRHQIGGFFAGARGSLLSLFSRSVATVQKFIADRHAEITAAATRALIWVRTAIVSALQTAQTVVARARTRINQTVERVKTVVQRNIEGITGRIIGLIDSIPLPDIPGIGWIRSQAVSLLNRAAGFVGRALNGFLGLLQSALDTALDLLDALMGAIGRALDTALAFVSAAIARVIQMVTTALNRAVAIIGTTLGRAMVAVVVPLITLIERLIIRVIGLGEQGALSLLRTNREQYLSSLADALTPQAPPAGARAASEASQIAVIRQLGREAAENNRRIVQTFAFVMGGAIASVIRTVVSALARIVSAIVSGLAAVMRTIATLIRLAIQILTQVVQAYLDFIREAIRSLTTWLDGVVEEVRSWIEGGVDRLMEFARDVLSRTGRFVVRFVRDLIGGRSVSDSLRDALGAFRGARYIPSFRGPAPPPPGVVIGIILAIFVALVGLLGGTVIIVGGTVIIMIGGAVYTIPVAVAVVIVLVVVAIAALLLWLLYRWLTKPKPPPGKRVILVTPSVLELGVGGRDITGTAMIAPGTPARPPLTWTINPGGAVPAGVSIIGGGRRVKVRAAQPPHGTVVGGAPVTVRAALTANPADFADSAPVMIVQVVSVAYVAAPPLVPVPITTPGWPPGVPPANSAEPNRDGIAGNTAVVNAITAPAARPITVSFRRSLGASVAGTTVTPGSRTGDVGLRISDIATRARLDETQPSTAGPAALMADLTVNAVPLRVSALAFTGLNPPPYGVNNRITFAVSDALHAPLTRIVGELITHVADDFNFPAPNGAFNPVFRLDLAVPANGWVDQLVARATGLSTVDGRPAIDVNRFIGPGVPGLPRRLVYRQRFQYSSWQGAGAVISRVFADGQHIKLLIGTPPAAFQFKIEHRFGGVASKPPAQPYAGPPLIVLTNVVAAPDAPGATALAADGAATAQLGVTSSVAGRTVNWTVRSGDIAITAGNPAVLPATATVRAGVRTGRFVVRAADTIYPNRQVDGRIGVVAVALRSMRAAPDPVPSGTASTTVTLNADPGGRTINWSVDAAAAAAGVTVTPATTGPGAPPMAVTVTRPVGFTGRVTVTAGDSVLVARTNRLRISFR